MNRQYEMTVDLERPFSFSEQEVTRVLPSNNTNNITGVKNHRVDELIDQYNRNSIFRNDRPDSRNEVFSPTNTSTLWYGHHGACVWNSTVSRREH
jgi:hypothetical protein